MGEGWVPTPLTMNDVFLLVAKAINGGLFVTAFALIGEVLKPKRFSGLFGAAPSVALANLLIIMLVKGHQPAHDNGVGMIAGSVAMAVACLFGVVLIQRYRSLPGSVMLCAVWLVVAVGLGVVVLR